MRALSKDGDLRIIDASGESYLCPADYFLLIDIPRGDSTGSKEVIWP